MGSNPPTFKKGTHVIIANPKTFWWGGGRGEGVEERDVSNCVKQTVTEFNFIYFIYIATISVVLIGLEQSRI